MLNSKSARAILPFALVASIVGWNTDLRAQAKPPSTKEDVRVGSTQSALDDPTVKRCRMLAGRLTDPSLDSITTQVDKAAMLLELQPVFDAVATCRAALMAYPNERKVIIAEANASDYLSMLALGMKFPDSEEQALALAVEAAVKQGNNSGMNGQMLGFYLGSAYEYGVGTKPDRVAAMKWYAVAAAAGDAISKRELARLQSAK